VILQEANVAPSHLTLLQVPRHLHGKSYIQLFHYLRHLILHTPARLRARARICIQKS